MLNFPLGVLTSESLQGIIVTYWLMKSEPNEYSIDDLEKDLVEPWDGIRNYQVRNMFRDDFKTGDRAFFYHSSCKTPAIVGTMRIVRKAYPDPTQFDPESGHFDARSNPDDPRWLLVDVEFERKLAQPITLTELKQQPELSDFLLNKQGNRLSVFSVSKSHWDFILGLER